MSSPSHTALSPEHGRGSTIQAPSSALDYKSDASTSAPEPKRKTSRIPFLGRVKKKLSNNLDKNTSSQAEVVPLDVRSPNVPTLSQSKSQSNLSADELAHESIPRPSQSSARTTQTIGSKIVSHLTPKKSRPKASGYASDSLSPPSSSTVSAIRPSFESAITAMRRDSRSATPRPSQPTITVSPSPTPNHPSPSPPPSNQVNEYQDLFTRPRRKSAPKSISISNHSRDMSGGGSRRGSLSTNFSDNESERKARLSVSPPTSAPSSSHEMSSASQSDTETGSRTSDRVSTRSSRSSHLEPVTKPGGGVSEDSDATANGLTINRRQRAMTSTSRIGAPPAGRPPSIPLPVPDNGIDSSPTTSTFSRTRSEPVRPRAQTLAFIPGSATQPQASLKAARSIPTPPLDAQQIVESFDIESASSEDLREEFRKRNQQLTDLANYLMSVSEQHLIERTDLEAKVQSLERELTRKDKEITGLTWLMKSHRNMPPSPPAAATSFSDSESRFSSRSLTNIPGRASTVKHPQYRRLILVNEDESAPDSQNESIYSIGWDSSSTRRSRGSKTRSIRSSLPQRDSAILNSPLPPIPLGKKTSSSSLGSGSSTTSSMLPSSPTSLSSIPEAPPPSRSSVKMRDPAIAAVIQQAEQYRNKEERRSTSQRPHRKPVPPPATAPPTPAEAYAANLRSSRPPSIAQVLERDIGKS